MSEIYQRPCLSPLSYDSPRRHFVDEIIWNLPTSPQRTGWMAPEYDDCRVIVQDLPVENNPWATIVRVPYLKGWNLKFRTDISKGPTIRMDEFSGALNQKENMFGRSFYGASIQVRNDSISREHLDSMKYDALSLIPSLCRPRGEHLEGGEENVPTTPWSL